MMPTVLAMAAFLGPARADEAGDQYAVAAGLYARGDWKLAAEEFETFLKRYPADSRADQSVFFLAGALLQAGRFDDAETRFAEYLRRCAGRTTCPGGDVPAGRGGLPRQTQ